MSNLSVERVLICDSILAFKCVCNNKHDLSSSVSHNPRSVYSWLILAKNLRHSSGSGETISSSITLWPYSTPDSC